MNYARKDDAEVESYDLRLIHTYKIGPKASTMRTTNISESSSSEVTSFVDLISQCSW